MKPVAALLILSGCLVTACGYQPAPKPPGYDSITETEADGIPPILSQEQLEALDEAQLQVRITQLKLTRRNTHGNPGVANTLDSQLEAAEARMTQLKANQ